MDRDTLLKHQLSERYRAFVICGAGLTGKTRCVKRLEEQYHGKYIDVMQTIYEDYDLRSHINAVRPEQIFSLITVGNRDEKLVIADHLDIVFSLWTETQQREFLRKLDMKSNGSCILAVLHNYKILENDGIFRNNSHGEKRIVNIAEIL